MHAFALTRHLKQCLKYMKTSYYSSGWRLNWFQQYIEKFPGFASLTAEDKVHLTTLSGANWLFLTFWFVMLDPLKTIKHCSFRKKTLPLLWCGRQASHKPVLALGPSAEKRVLRVGALDVLLLEQFWLIRYKGVTDKNGPWKTIPAAVGCGGSPECPENWENLL